jgi:hypothetical protein
MTKKGAYLIIVCLLMPAVVGVSNPSQIIPTDILVPTVTSLNIERVRNWAVADPVDLHVYDNQAYIAQHIDRYDPLTDAILSILDISDPAHPTEIGDPIEGPYGGSYHTVYADSNYIYTAEDYPNYPAVEIHAYQQSATDDYVCWKKFDYYSKAIEMWSHSGYWLLVDGNLLDHTGNGLQVFKPTPTQPYDNCEFVTSYEVSGKVTTAAYDDQYAYIGTVDGSLWILDVSAPNLPSKVSNTPYGSVPIDAIATAPGYVYLAQGTEIKIIDISNPASPGAARTFTSPVQPAQLGAQGGYLYITFADGMYVYDVGDSSSPVQAGYYLDYDDEGFGSALHLANDLIFAAGLDTMNILRFTGAPQSEPAVLLETLSTGIWVDGVEVPYPCEMESTASNGMQDLSLDACPTVQTNSKLEFKSTESKQKLKLWLQCIAGVFYAISVDDDDVAEGLYGEAALNFILIATAAACEEMQPWTTQSNASPFIVIGHEHGALRYTFQQEQLTNEIRTDVTTILSDGTNDFGVNHDPLANQTTVSCYNGSVILVPENPELPPIALSTGQQVEITGDSVGSITEIIYQAFVPLVVRGNESLTLAR